MVNWARGAKLAAVVVGAFVAQGIAFRFFYQYDTAFTSISAANLSLTAIWLMFGGTHQWLRLGFTGVAVGWGYYLLNCVGDTQLGTLLFIAPIFTSMCVFYLHVSRMRCLPADQTAPLNPREFQWPRFSLSQLIGLMTVAAVVAALCRNAFSLAHLKTLGYERTLGLVGFSATSASTCLLAALFVLYQGYARFRWVVCGPMVVALGSLQGVICWWIVSSVLSSLVAAGTLVGYSLALLWLIRVIGFRLGKPLEITKENPTVAPLEVSESPSAGM